MGPASGAALRHPSWGRAEAPTPNRGATPTAGARKNGAPGGRALPRRAQAERGGSSSAHNRGLSYFLLDFAECA
eukprot:15430938-Alexandrium_andersonii.AAC.1